MKQGWEIKKFGEVCHSIADGDWIEKKDQSTSGIRLIQTGNIGIGIYKDKADNSKFIDEKTFKTLRCTEIFEGDLLISRLPDPVGRACLLPKMNSRCITAVDCSILKINKQIVHPKYVIYYTQSIIYFNLVKSECTGTTRNRITRKKLSEIDIKYPLSILEQERIVGILDSAFAKIEALRANAQQNLQNAKDLFQASLKQELTPKQGWVSKKLNEICEVKDGTHDSPKYVDDGIPFVTQKNITINGFDIQDTRRITVNDHQKFYKRSNVEYGDILISMIGANRGMSCIVDINDTFSIKNVGLVKQNDNIKQRYLLHYLQSPMSAKYVADASNGGAQEFIGLTALRAFPILFPENSEEQQSIVEKLDALSERCRAMEDNYRQTLTTCNDLKQALLKKAFNGEL